jgi:tyrosyl-tRNA synthetase
MFGKNKIITDEKKIDEVLDRYTEEILPNRDSLKKKLLSGDRLKIYVGADPTGKDLHLGHGVAFFLMEELRKLGHEIIILFGGFTAMIGDPTDKGAARVRLSHKETSENIKSWKNQVSKIISFKDFFNKPKIVNNNDWYSKMSLGQIVDIASNFTVQNMIERDMFQERMKNEKPVYVHEFFYPLLQGYDSVVLDVDVEVGGTDQTFNMLAGRTLLSKIKKKDKTVVSIPLLANPKTGKKMSKSEGSYVAILDKPNDMFGKIMSLPDEMMVNILQYTTKTSMDKVSDIKQRFEKGDNPKELKEDVAFEVVKTYHNEPFAKKAKENFSKLFSKKEITDDIKEFDVEKDITLQELLLQKEIIKSKSEFRRLVDQGAVSVFEGEKIKDPNYKLEKEEVIRVGKKNIFKVKIK